MQAQVRKCSETLLVSVSDHCRIRISSEDRVKTQSSQSPDVRPTSPWLGNTLAGKKLSGKETSGGVERQGDL